jgi:selenocysteine-specific elongation factor
VECRVIIGTAGHIDHGKSALIEALTGVRMDRLREERERGITIDLNFAPLVLGDGRVAGVVDVPGHEDFVRTMVAGASGMDLVLLVIAADEGIKPQTGSTWPSSSNWEFPGESRCSPRPTWSNPNGWSWSARR